MASKAFEWMLFTLKMCSIITTRTWIFLSVRAPRGDLQILNGHFRMHLLICMIDCESCCNVVCIALSHSSSLSEQLLNISLRSLRKRHISSCSFTASGRSHFGLSCRIGSVCVAFLLRRLICYRSVICHLTSSLQLSTLISVVHFEWLAVVFGSLASLFLGSQRNLQSRFCVLWCVLEIMFKGFVCPLELLCIDSRSHCFDQSHCFDRSHIVVESY